MPSNGRLLLGSGLIFALFTLELIESKKCLKQVPVVFHMFENEAYHKSENHLRHSSLFFLSTTNLGIIR